MTQYLFELEKDISSTTKGLALRNAAENGHHEIVEYLLQVAADIPIYYKDLAKAVATKQGFTKIVESISKKMSPDPQKNNIPHLRLTN